MGIDEFKNDFDYLVLSLQREIKEKSLGLLCSDPC